MTTGNYFSSGVIKHGASVEMNVIERKWVCQFFIPVTSDKNSATCINASQAQGQLQAIFTFPTLYPRSHISIKVTLMNVDDCTSPAWTWFVESGCVKGVYNECSSTQITQVAEFTTCILTCYCMASCDFLYLKYNRLPLRDQSSEQLCEIWALRDGHNWPGYDGSLAWASWWLKPPATALFFSTAP